MDQAHIVERIAEGFLSDDDISLRAAARLVLANAHLRVKDYQTAITLTDPLKSWFHGFNSLLSG